MSSSVWIEPARNGRKPRVCWRNIARTAKDGRALPDKCSVAVEDRATRERLVGRIRDALDLEFYYEHRPIEVPRVACFVDGSAAWVASRESESARGTTLVLVSAFRRIYPAIRRLERIAPGGSIPASVLRRELFERLRSEWSGELSAWRVYDLVTHMLGAWRWMATDPERFPGVPTPPFDDSQFRPKPPPRVRPPEPTLSELDAICRRAAATGDVDLRDVLVALRLTGLRIGQVLAARVEDVDFSRKLLTVTTGKSRREKATQPELPIHLDLVATLHARTAEKHPRAFLFPAPRRSGPLARRDAALRKLWEAATAADEVRRGAWNPGGRRKTRPHHAFRAGFLAGLRDAGVDAEVRHALVGHADATTEARHYSGPTAKDKRVAIDKLPGIDWGLEEDGSAPAVDPPSNARQLGAPAARPAG